MPAKSIMLFLFAAAVMSTVGCKKDSTTAAKPATTPKHTTPATPVQDPTTGASGVSYTSRMGGTRNWHRYHYYHAEGMHFDSTINEDYFLPDTSFALTILSDTSIAFLGNTFSLDRTHSTSTIYYYGYNAWSFFQYSSGLGVTYFSDRDSIVYGSGDVHHTSDYIVRKDRWSTY